MPKLFVSNKNESVRMFKSDFLELFSKVHFTVPLFVFVPVIGYLYYISFFQRSYSILQIVLLSLGGLITWTITEYLLHRFIFHIHATSKWGKRIMFVIHEVHHDYPNDANRLVMPPVLSIPLALIFYHLYGLMVGNYNIPVFFAAFLIGYLIYDMGHYAIHHFSLKGKYWGAIKAHHMRHHYVDPDRGYGVSSPLWDLVLKTGYKKDEQPIEE